MPEPSIAPRTVWANSGVESKSGSAGWFLISRLSRTRSARAQASTSASGGIATPGPVAGAILSSVPIVSIRQLAARSAAVFSAHLARAVGRPVERRVVHHDRHAVGGQLDVELDHVGAERVRVAERLERVLGLRRARRSSAARRGGRGSRRTRSCAPAGTLGASAQRQRRRARSRSVLMLGTLTLLVEPIAMADDPVMLITGASTGIGAATARQAVEAGYRVVLAARSEDKLRDLASELGGDERAIAQRCDVAQLGRPGGADARPRSTPFGRVDAVFANAGFGAARGFLEGDARAVALDGRDERPRRRLLDPRGAAPPARARHRPLRDHQLGRRPPRAARVAVLGDQARGHRDRRGAAPGAAERRRRGRHPRDADRAGHGRHAVLRQPGVRRARSPTTSPAR